MKVIAVTEYKEKVFLGIEQANIVRKSIKENGSWENYYRLGMLWTDDCRYIQLSRNYYLRLDVSLKAARRCFYRALSKSPQNPKVFSAIGWTYIIHCPKPNYIKIKRFFTSAHKSAPQNSFYSWCVLAVAYMLGEYEELYRALSKTSQDNLEIFFLSQITYAFALIQQSKYGQAYTILKNIKLDMLCKLSSLDEAVWTLIEAYYCIGEIEYAERIYKVNQANKMLIGSPCRKYFENEADETVSEREQNRKEILKYFNPLRMVRWYNYLVGHSMDDLSDEFLLKQR